MNGLVVNAYVAPVLRSLEENLPQGLLLEGPIGVGLATIGQTLAASYAKTVYPVSPEKGVITIERIRELYALTKTNTGKLVILIDDADTMGREASNALLKLLEEPGANVRFILTTHFREALLPTITSRVQIVSIPPISAAQTADVIGTSGIVDEQARRQLAFIAGGLPASLIRLSSDAKLFDARAAIVRDARGFLTGSREDRLLIASKYSSDRENALVLVRDMMRLVQAPDRTGARVSILEHLLSVEADLRENSSVRLRLSDAALTL